jgi:cytochrome P450
MTSQETSRDQGDAVEGRPAFYWDPFHPVSYDDGLGAWNVCSYHDVEQVLLDPDHYSIGVSDEDRLHGNPTLAGLWMVDGKHHDDLLALVAPRFRRATLTSLQANIARIAAELLDAATAGGGHHLEAVSAIAHPLPGAVICDLLGIPRDAAARMHQWREEVWGLAGGYSQIPPQPDMTAYFEQVIQEHRQTPQPGLLGELLRAQAAGQMVDGQPLTDRDLLGYLAMFVWGGAETTAGALADALLFLTDYGHWPALRAQPALIPRAVEEVLRWSPSFPAVRLLVVADTTVGGQVLRAGDWVMAWLTAANRDPRIFDDPNTFDPRRAPNPHLTFGQGGHFCLGAPLARLELRVLVEQATQRLPRLRPDPERPPRRRIWMEDTLPELHLRY